MATDTLINEHYWLVNLLLSDAIAKRYGLHRAAAVKRCAKRMRDGTKSQRLYDLAQMIIKAPDERVCAMVSGLYLEMKKDGMI